MQANSKIKGLKFFVIIVVLAFISGVVYLGIKIFKEVTPKSYNELHLQCLELGSDFARKSCLRNIASKNEKVVSIFNEFKKVSTPEEKAALWDKYVKNGTIDESSAIQLKALFGDENI